MEKAVAVLITLTVVAYLIAGKVVLPMVQALEGVGRVLGG